MWNQKTRCPHWHLWSNLLHVQFGGNWKHLQDEKCWGFLSHTQHRPTLPTAAAPWPACGWSLSLHTRLSHTHSNTHTWLTHIHRHMSHTRRAHRNLSMTLRRKQRYTGKGTPLTISTGQRLLPRLMVQTQRTYSTVFLFFFFLSFCHF